MGTTAQTVDRQAAVPDCLRSVDHFVIGGEPVPPIGAARLQVVSPVTGGVIASCPEGTAADMDRAVDAARRAFDDGPWPRMSRIERSDVLMKAAEIYASRIEEIAQLVTAEVGTPISESRPTQAGGPAAILRYVAELGRSQPSEEIRNHGNGMRTLVTQEAVGVVAAVVPWNFPQASLMVKVANALLAGCTFVAKPSPETPLDAYLLADVFKQAGVPGGVVSVVPADRAASEALISHPGVDKVAFTGSTAAGQSIGSLCGRDLRRVTLELGGKSAALVLDDIHLDASTFASLGSSLMRNSGQTCSNQTRVLVPRSRYDSVVDGLVSTVKSFTVGDPLDPATVIGPMVSERHRERVEGYIAIGRQEGRLVCGGGRPSGLPGGWWVEPTIFVDIDNSARVAQEEIFGPVVVVIPYDDEDDAVALANDSKYGLSGSVWTSDPNRGVSVARRIRSGTVKVNWAATGLSAPAGGFKQSGIGRELGLEGLSSFIEVRSIGVPADWDPAHS